MSNSVVPTEIAFANSCQTIYLFSRSTHEMYHEILLTCAVHWPVQFIENYETPSSLRLIEDSKITGVITRFAAAKLGESTRTGAHSWSLLTHWLWAAWYIPFRFEIQIIIKISSTVLFIASWRRLRFWAIASRHSSMEPVVVGNCHMILKFSRRIPELNWKQN